MYLVTYFMMKVNFQKEVVSSEDNIFCLSSLYNYVTTSAARRITFYNVKTFNPL